MAKKYNSVVDFTLSSDENYVQLFLTTIVSVMNHASKDVLYRCYYFYDGIKEESKQKIKKVASKFKNLELKMYSRDVLNIPPNLNDKGRFSQSTFDRLKVADFLTDLDKIIYIDCDSFVVTDIKELYDIDLKGNYVAAKHDFGMHDFCKNEYVIKDKFPNYIDNKYEDMTFKDYVEKFLGFEDYKDYFNAGCLVLDLKQLRDNEIGDKLIAYIKEYEPLFNDQCALNLLCKDKVVYLDPSWNTSYYRAYIIDKTGYEPEEKAYEEVRKHPRSFSVKRGAIFKPTIYGAGIKDEYLKIEKFIEKSCEPLIGFYRKNDRLIIKFLGIKIKLKA